MSHFASANVPATFGYAASLSVAGNLNSTAAPGTVVTSTEGTNKLTYAVTTSGLYKISSYLRTAVASDAGTHTLAAVVTYNNGTAVSQASIGPSGVTPGTMNQKTGAGTALTQEMTIWAAAGTNIVLAVSEVIGTSAATVGSYDIRWLIAGVL